MRSNFAATLLGSIAHIEMGQSPDSSTVREGAHGGVPFLQGNAEFGVAHPTPRFSCVAPMKMCRAGDILISVRAPVGAMNIADRDYCIGRGLAAVRVPGMSPSLAAHMVSAAAPALRRVAQGTTFEAINKTDLASLVVMAPPQADREPLGLVLDTLDTTIRRTEAIIEKLKQVKQGLLHDLLTRGIDRNCELRPPQWEAPHLYQKSPLGWIPREWTASSIDETCSEVVDCPHSTPTFLEDGVLVARTMHIKDGVFLRRLASRVSEAEYRERIARLCPAAGDVVFTREAPVGEAFVIPAGMRICLGQRVMLLRPRPEVALGQFLLAQIYSGAVADRIAALTAGTTNPHLNVSEVRQFILPLPPLTEQTMIEQRLGALVHRIAVEGVERDKLLTMKSGLMDDLLTGRVRVTPLLA